MKKRVQLVVPMSGQGKRFQAAGYAGPKPLIPVSGRPMISRLLESFPRAWPAYFVLAENHRDSGLTEALKQERSDGTIVFVPAHELGPGHALRAVLPRLSPEDPVFVSYCDYGMSWDVARFERMVSETGCDAGVTCYRGFHAHYLSPLQYAYCRMAGDRVVEIKEKGCFTDNRENEYASAGGYYFRSARLLADALEHQRELSLSHNGEYYTSLTVEALLRRRPKCDVRVFEIQEFHQWGTPADLRAYEYWQRAMAAHHRLDPAESAVDQLLMPMAGRGSRFSSQSVPKPLIRIGGQAMFQRALGSLPRARRRAIVALDELRSSVGKLVDSDTSIVSLAETPPGQALSTEAGLKTLDPDREVLVSACDHGIVLDPAVWKRFRAQGFDAGIFTVRGYPGVSRNPTAYAYVTCAPGRPELVERVLVKQPPPGDLAEAGLLVGTFWFRTVRVALDAIQELKKRDLRVRGELYLDSVFSLLIEKGSRVGNIPLEGYLGWGDPDSVRETEYWSRVFPRPMPFAKTGT